MGFLTKDRLIFDPADLSVSDQVGSYVIGADGTVIGNVSDALKVSFAGSVTVTATDLDIRDLVFATDKVDVSGSSVSISGSVTVTATDLDIRNLVFATDKVDVSGSSVTVSATDLDIRNLSSAQDNVEIKTAAGQALAIDGSGFLTVNQGGTWNVNLTDDSVADGASDTGNPFKVGGQAYASALSSTAAGNRVNMAFDRFRRIRTFAGAQVSLLTSALVVVGLTAVPLPATALLGRQKILVQNDSAKDIYVGSSGVTTATGIRIAKGSTMELDVGEIALYAISDTAALNIRVLELA